MKKIEWAAVVCAGLACLFGFIAVICDGYQRGFPDKVDAINIFVAASPSLLKRNDYVGLEQRCSQEAQQSNDKDQDPSKKCCEGFSCKWSHKYQEDMCIDEDHEHGIIGKLKSE